MDKKTEALRLALEALESDWDGCVNSPKGEAITAIREALAEAQQQEPVIDKSAAIRIATALGWAPRREWVGLTDEEIWKDDALMSANSGYGATFDTLRDIVRAIEAKLREKNHG